MRSKLSKRTHMLIKTLKESKDIVIFLLVIGMLCPHLCYGYGLRTGFGKVILENVPMGKVYSMRRDSEFPLVIKNESDRRLELKLEVLVPEQNEVQEGYEAIPEVSWVTLEKDSFTIEPGGEAETDVFIHIPYDERYLGRRFHVFIWSHTIGESVGIGIKSKLLFKIEEAKE